MIKPNTWIHIIWATQNYKRVFDEHLSGLTTNHIQQNARDKNILLDRIHCAADHIHLLVHQQSHQTLATIVQCLKGESSHWMNKQQLLHFKFRWNEEYYAQSVDPNSLNDVRRLIDSQTDYHLSSSLGDELAIIITNPSFNLSQQEVLG